MELRTEQSHLSESKTRQETNVSKSERRRKIVTKSNLIEIDLKAKAVVIKRYIGRRQTSFRSSGLCREYSE